MAIQDDSVHFGNSVSQSYHAAVFLLLPAGVLQRFEGVEVPAYSYPEHTAEVPAAVFKRIDIIVGVNVPSPCIENIREQG